MSNGAVDTIYIEFSSNADSVTSGIDKLNDTLNRIKKVTQNGSSGVGKMNTKLSTLRSTTTKFYNKLSRLVDVAGSWFKKSNEYVEALNLFNVAMGDGAEAAMNYAEKVQDLMGIDIKDWMEYQGGFYQLTAGYGIANEQAETMSKNLTQLAYDLSSLWNVDVDTAFQKLQSGMSGQIKGLKVWGINLSVAQLRETALAHGITLSTSKMTEAQKATLRYITVMEKTKSVQGDLARTIDTPANALRVLNAQWEMTKRSLGNIVSVLAVKVIPYFQAFTIVVRTAANALASLMGYELPEIDYSTIPDTGITDLTDDTEDATESLKKLKKEAMGFDELNILSTDDSSNLNNYDPTFGLDLSKYDYDFLGETSSKAQEIADEWIKALEPLLPVLEGFALVFSGFWDALTWVGETFILPILTGIGNWLKEHPEAAKIIGEIAAAFFILNTALKAIKWVRELTAVQSLTNWFSRLRGKTGQVTDAFGRKNTSLERQTARTYQEAYAVSALVAAFAAAAAAARAFGSDILKIPDKLPSLNPSPVPSFGLVPALQSEFATANSWLASQSWTLPVLSLAGLGLLPMLMSAFNSAKSWLSSQSWSLPALGGVPAFGTAIANAFNSAKSWLSSQTWSLPAISVGDLGILTAVTMAFMGAKSWLSSQSWSLPQIEMPDFSSWFNTAGQAIGSFVGGIGNAFNSVASYLSSSEGAWLKWSLVVVAAIAAITVAIVALNSQTGGMGGSAIGGMLSGLGAIGAYAAGGFPDEGEMFVAREAGPELVGTIGSKTAVANNNQIVDAVSTGVAKAVSSVMGGAQQPQQLGGSLKIKGSDLVYVVDKANRSKGATISNNFKYGGR